MFLIRQCFVLFLFLQPAMAYGLIEWTGQYRFEAHTINDLSMDDLKGDASYGVHHLVLNSQIEATDAIDIKARFDIFNDTDVDQLGNLWGGSVSKPRAGSKTEPREVKVSELYLNYGFDNFLFVLGRAPLDFGLGILNNNGHGDFDHWLSSRDLAAIKFKMGSFTISPMYANLLEGKVDDNDDVRDYIIQLDYDRPDTGLKMGFYYQKRKSSAGSFGLHTGNYTANRDLNLTTYSVFIKREYKNLSWGIEGSTQSGDLGVEDNGTNASVEADGGVGIAAELNYKWSKWGMSLKAGFASGDDPSTTEKYEGFNFARNYDVAHLLFNYKLGQEDFLVTDGSLDNNNISVDAEAISNAYYIAPTVTYQWNEKLRLDTSVIAGFLDVETAGNADKDLGFEVDLTANWEPHDRLRLAIGGAVLLPGKAFEGGVNQYETDTVYGLFTKAAIHF